MNVGIAQVCLSVHCRHLTKAIFFGKKARKIAPILMSLSTKSHENKCFRKHFDLMSNRFSKAAISRKEFT